MIFRSLNRTFVSEINILKMSIQENIVAAALSGVKELYGAEVPEKMIQLQETRPEFEG